MAQRMLSEACCTSDRLALVSAEAERMYWRLTSRADDYGRFYGDPRLVRSACFPLRTDDFSLEMIDLWISELALPQVGLVCRYVVNGRAYLAMPFWYEEQRKRESKPKFPAPPAVDSPQAAATCGELPLVAARASETATATASSSAGDLASGGSGGDAAPIGPCLPSAVRRAHPFLDDREVRYVELYVERIGGPPDTLQLRRMLDSLRALHPEAKILAHWWWALAHLVPDDIRYFSPQTFARQFIRYDPAPQPAPSPPPTGGQHARRTEPHRARGAHDDDKWAAEERADEDRRRKRATKAPPRAGTA